MRSGRHRSVAAPDRTLHSARGGGHVAAVQWTAADHTTRVGTLIADSLLVSVTLTPDDWGDEALALAAAVDHATLAQAVRRPLLDGW